MLFHIKIRPVFHDSMSQESPRMESDTSTSEHASPLNTSIKQSTDYQLNVEPQTQVENNDNNSPYFENKEIKPDNNLVSAVGDANCKLSRTNVYVCGLPPQFTDEDLSGICEGFGRIRSSRVINDRKTNKCKGYGFADFDTHDSAIAVIKKLNETTPYKAYFAKQRDFDPTNLYIARLSPNVTESVLESVLRDHGNIVSVRILKNRNGKSKRIGFVRMETTEMCEKVIEKLGGKIIPELSDSMIVVKFADWSKSQSLRNVQDLYNPTYTTFGPTMLDTDPYVEQLRLAQQVNLLLQQVAGMLCISPSYSYTPPIVMPNQLCMMPNGEAEDINGSVPHQTVNLPIILEEEAINGIGCPKQNIIEQNTISEQIIDTEIEISSESNALQGNGTVKKQPLNMVNKVDGTETVNEVEFCAKIEE